MEKKQKKFFITTAISYVNDRPHVGHALEFVQADTLVRHQRLPGDAQTFVGKFL